MDLIIEGGNDYIITIKGNQPKLLKASIALAESSLAIDSHHHHEYLHGRSTTRHTLVYSIPPELLPDWKGAKTLIQVERFGTRPKGKKSREFLWLVSLIVERCPVL